MRYTPPVRNREQKGHIHELGHAAYVRYCKRCKDQFQSKTREYCYGCEGIRNIEAAEAKKALDAKET